MFADAAFNWDVSRSQKTQATVATSAKGTQCPLTLLINASSQTEEEFPVPGGHKTEDGASQEFPASGDYADTAAEAGPRTYYSPPHSGSTRMVMKPVQGRARRSPAGPSQRARCVLKVSCKKIRSGGVLHSCESSEHKHASPQGKVCANIMAYICTVCAKVFYGKAKIDRHMRVHTGERPYTCTVCQKSFTQKETLICHGRLHSGEKPYVCSTCHESFTRRSHLVAHERLHSGEKPYVCSTCHESFTTRSHLVAHERLHSGDGPYVCSTCQKSFGEKSRLVIHERLHTGERPYVCTTCQKSYTAKRYLRAHEKLQHGERPYVCSANQTSLANVTTCFLLKE